MHVSIRPNFFGRKLVVFAALSTLFGVAMAQTADTPSTPQTSAPGAKLEHDHIHPLPTTEEIPASNSPNSTEMRKP